MIIYYYINILYLLYKLILPDTGLCGTAGLSFSSKGILPK